jgi:hypothetical protein
MEWLGHFAKGGTLRASFLVTEHRTQHAVLLRRKTVAGYVDYRRSGERLGSVAIGSFSENDSLSSSNQRETAAVLRALTTFKDLLQNANVHGMTIRSDNTATVCNLQRQGAGKPLLKLTREIFKKLMKMDIRVRAVHVPGVENVLTDALSRMKATGDYELKMELYV